MTVEIILDPPVGPQRSRVKCVRAMPHGSRASRRRRIHSGPRVLSAKSRGTRANAGVRTVVAPAAEGRSGSRIPAYTIPIAPSRTGTICCHIRFRGARTERSSGTGPSGEFGNHCDRCRVYDKMLVTPTGLRVARGLLSQRLAPACLRPYVPPAPRQHPKTPPRLSGPSIRSDRILYML